MNYLYRTQAYLNSITATANSLCGMILSDALQGNIEMQYKITVTLLELEQATADFIDSIGLFSELQHAVSASKRKFMNVNKRLIKHLEKLQSQGYHFEELIHILKLENNTLEKEIHFL